MMIGTNGLALESACLIFWVSLSPSNTGMAQLDQHDVGRVVGECIEAGGAVLGLGTSRGPNPCSSVLMIRRMWEIVVDDKQTQAIEIDVNHAASAPRQSSDLLLPGG